MKLYPNSVFANVFYANKCFQTSLFFRPVSTLIRVIWSFLGLIRALRIVCRFLFGYSKCFPYSVDKTIYFCHCLHEQLIKLVLTFSLPTAAREEFVINTLVSGIIIQCPLLSKKGGFVGPKQGQGKKGGKRGKKNVPFQTTF